MLSRCFLHKSLMVNDNWTSICASIASHSLSVERGLVGDRVKKYWDNYYLLLYSFIINYRWPHDHVRNAPKDRTGGKGVQEACKAPWPFPWRAEGVSWKEGERVNYVKKKALLYRSKVEYANFCINHVFGCAHGCRGSVNSAGSDLVDFKLNK